MKRTTRVAIALMMATGITVLTGCSTGQEPNFSGRYKHSSPSADDYYPSKKSTNTTNTTKP